MGWPLVTVAVPMFNEGDQFVASLDALLSIEYPNLEIIVVDDGSTDFSFDVAQKRFGVLPHDSLRTQVIPPIDQRREK
jgi:cellulose synthase/poly-beta-1,6-N-acetylglucosamine synthase-like glycosyltransferase